MKNTKVLLLKDVAGLGEAGDVKTVRGGYARNYLIPRGLALLATPQNLKRADEIRRVRQQRLERMKAQAQELAKRIEETPVEIGLLVGEEGKAFGSVKSSDILMKLAEAGINVEKGSIALDEPIKAIGEYQIQVKLHPEVSATLQLKVVPKE